ncbi:putative PurR-regulated permease PerM [Sphingomonas vulcanisoli]|uniref:PurR-regulated permease PerM n=1 Tax=Sphingomonas vulcanisoli TaxID=1658060 RepID=A0ABX0TRW2_9SPHN|nr:AI-2E family transporter [Sphingomonas vulcanisoli]NIJ07818.1 putative PurR-regulated permease PerM [Sphingomonas vulcanisoli]
MSDEPDRRERSQRIAKIAVALLLAGIGLWVAHSFVAPIVWAGVIAIAIDPLYTRAERRWPRTKEALLPAAATLAIAVLILVPLALVVVEAAREASGLVGWFGEARRSGIPAPLFIQHLPFSNDITRWWQDNFGTAEATQHQFHRFQDRLLLRHTQLVGRDLLRRTIVFLFTLLALFFVLRDRVSICRQFALAGERLLGHSGERLGRQVILSVRGTIDGLVLVGLGEGAVMLIVYLIAGVPHPLLLGALTAVGAMIPFGASVLIGIASILLIGAGSFGWAVAVFVIGMGVIAVADHFVRPVLIGGATQLPFLLVLIGILGGVEVLGLLGLFVGPAVMATLVLLWRDYVAHIPKGDALPEA